MTKLRQLWLLTALGSLAVLAGGYFLLVSPQANKAAALRAETATQDQLNRKLQSQIQMLNRQKKDLPAQQAELAKFATKVPNNPAMPALLRSVSDAADNSGVELRAMSPAQPALVPAKPAVAGKPATAAAASAGPNGLQLAQIPISIQVVGNYSQISQFLSEVERLPRAFLVNGLAVKPGGELKGGDSGGATSVASDLLTADLTGQLFMMAKVTPPPVARPTTAATAPATAN